MRSFQLLICIACAIVSSWAAIPYTDVQINIFDSRPPEFELRVLNSMSSTRKFYVEHNVSSIVDTLAQQSPYVGELTKTVRLLRDTMTEQSDWRALFTKVISDETLRDIIDSEERRMKSIMQTVETKIKILGENNPDRSNRKTIASILHTELDKLINFFDLKTTLCRRYPLMGATPLIQLASLVSIFTPYAKALIPLEAMSPQISCKMRDVLLDYRPRAVNERLHQLHADESIFKSLVKVMSMPYNKYGYNHTNPGVINCKRGCKAPSKHQPSNELCLRDKFGSVEFDVNLNEPTCIEDYAALVRHRVEELFPVDLLEQVCVEPEPKEPTGFGWFTINMQTVFTYGEIDGSSCKFYSKFGCDSYIKLFVNDKELLKSGKTKDKFAYDAGITFTTDRISKDSIIKIEVWDSSSAFWEKKHLILKTEGNVESWLKQPHRAGVMVGEKQNAIETVSFWQDEYKDAE